MERIFGGRYTGKTVNLIKTCQRLNREHGVNDTIIVAKNRQDAKRISKMADEMGYTDMPFPITVEDIVRCRPNYYRKLLIDDIDVVFQQMIGTWELEGFTVNTGVG